MIKLKSEREGLGMADRERLAAEARTAAEKRRDAVRLAAADWDRTMSRAHKTGYAEALRVALADWDRALNGRMP